jgi:hypothetical protein
VPRASARAPAFRGPQPPGRQQIAKIHHDVRAGDDADQVALIHHRQPPDIVLDHHPGGLQRALIGIETSDPLENAMP